MTKIDPVQAMVSAAAEKQSWRGLDATFVLSDGSVAATDGKILMCASNTVKDEAVQPAMEAKLAEARSREHEYRISIDPGLMKQFCDTLVKMVGVKRPKTSAATKSVLHMDIPAGRSEPVYMTCQFNDHKIEGLLMPLRTEDAKLGFVPREQLVADLKAAQERFGAQARMWRERELLMETDLEAYRALVFRLLGPKVAGKRIAAALLKARKKARVK